MKIICNEHIIDRLTRAFTGTLLLGIGLFWIGGVIATIIMVLGGTILLTALAGWCPLYCVLGKSTCSIEMPKHRTLTWVVFALLYVGTVVGGSYASIFFSSKFFLEDFNALNNAYKQTLFHTGQGAREVSVADYEALATEVAVFKVKYEDYRPYAVRNDEQLSADIEKVDAVVNGLREVILTGDLNEAHLALEDVRPILQDILKRNGFSLLAVALIDFHDAMELVLTPAEAKDSAGVLAAYSEASMKLQVVEAEANDTEIQAIRTNLEMIKSLAEEGQVDALPEQAATLKSSFVKVYLARG